MYDRPNCPCGQEATELDHQDALVLAWTSGDPRRMMRAHTLANLTWLCEDCHRPRQPPTSRNWRTCGRTKLPGGTHTRGPPDGHHPPPGPGPGFDYWISVEGGIVRRISPQDGELWGTKPNGLRGPVTFQPENVRCPRCLVAMEHLGPRAVRPQPGNAPGLVHRPARRRRRAYQPGRRPPVQDAEVPGRKNSGRATRIRTLNAPTEKNRQPQDPSETAPWPQHPQPKGI